MPGRKFRVENAYRYGFNGKENDDDVKGEGNQQDYGMRIYDPRIGKFLSVDPLTQKYPELTPYQFASNRPIDGVDLDGMEYITYSFIIGVSSKTGMRIMFQGYNWHNENQHNAHGNLGRGVLYDIKFYDEDKKIFSGSQNEFVSRNGEKLWGVVMTEYGNYMGATGLYKMSEEGRFTKEYDYDLPPVDQVDFGAYMHDKGYDKLGAVGANSLFGDFGTTPVDEDALNLWNNFLSNSKVGSKDPYMGEQPVTQTERNAAWQGSALFKFVINKKKADIALFMQDNYADAEKGLMTMRGFVFTKYQVKKNYDLFLQKYMEKDAEGSWIRKKDMWNDDGKGNFTPKETK